MKAADAFNPLHYDMIMIGAGRGMRAAIMLLALLHIRILLQADRQ